MLKQRALSATIWSGAETFMRQGLQFVVSIVLARLVTPAEFGTIALLYVFTGIAGVFIDSGFAAALVQKKDTTHEDESTVFWFNLLIGAVVALLLWGLAPFIARFFAKPVLVPLTGVMALTIFLSALGTIHATLLGKRLDFRTQMKVTVVAIAVSGSVAIWLAWKGYGVWALAAQALTSAASTTAMFWLVNPWRPARRFSLASARSLFGFGSYVLASSLFGIIYARIYTVLIGKLFGVRELGYYNRADATVNLPVGVLSGILNRVTFPIFSAASGDKVLLQRGVRLSVRGLMLLNVPMMLGLAAIARPAVLALFGSRWLPIVPILQVLCLAGMMKPLHIINLSALVAQGHSKLFFRLEMIKKSIGLVFLAVGAVFGVMGIAWSTAIFGVVEFLINAHYTKQHLGYGALRQFRDFLPILTLSIPMFLLTHWVAGAWTAPPIVATLGIALIGALYIVLAGWLVRLQALRDVVSLFHRSQPNSQP